MSSSTPGKVKHLTLVKEGVRPAAVAKVVSADELSPEQSLACTRAARMANSSGVLVSALIGETAWDIRPMLLENESLFIVRLSDPLLSLHSDKFYALRDLLHQFESSSTALLSSMSSGQADGQLWVKRRFFQRSMQDFIFTEGSGSALHPLQFVQRLVWLVYALHQSSIVHGHIHPGNAALDHDRAVLFDPGFYAFTPGLQPDVNGAPELREGSNLTPAVDVYGLGVLIRKVMAQRLTEEHAAFVDRMLQNDPAKRPVVSEIVEFFKPDPARLLGKQVQITPVRNPAHAGKLIANPSRHSKRPAKAEAPPIELTHEVAAVQEPRERNHKSKRDRGAAGELKRRPHARAQGDSDIAISVSRASVRRWTGLVLFAAVVGGAAYLMSGMSGITFFGSIPHAAYWGSGQPSLMYKVAEEALARPTGEAAILIVSEALRGVKHPPVNDKILRLVFRPEWEQTLSAADRELALRLALLSLVPAQPEQVQLSADTHPAVALAVAAQVPEDAIGDELSQVPVAKLSDLPEPYGAMFSVLSTLGVSVLSEPSARGLAHIVAGDASTRMLELFFGDASSSSEVKNALTQKKVAILVPLLEQDQELSEAVYEFQRKEQSIISARILWFEADPFGIWRKSPRADLLALCASETPARTLAFEEYADLLAFNSQRVRKEASGALLKILRKQVEPMLEFLTSAAHRLTREQIIMVLLALRLDGDAAFPLIASLVQSDPPAEDLFMLLVLGGRAEGIDSFNLGVERYLNGKKWSASIDALRRLTFHRDKLARILAYSRLDPRIPGHAELLKEASQREPDVTTRASALEKLAGANKRHTPAPPEESAPEEAGE